MSATKRQLDQINDGWDAMDADYFYQIYSQQQNQ